jgi:hypothetical protein
LYFESKKEKLKIEKKEKKRFVERISSSTCLFKEILFWLFLVCQRHVLQWSQHNYFYVT